MAARNAQTWADDLLSSKTWQALDDLVCSGSDDEYYDSPAQRLERIEAQARRCLEGQPIFLISAALRGPFTAESGWKNPWRSKRTARKPLQSENQVTTELPTTHHAIASGCPNEHVTFGDEFRELDGLAYQPLESGKDVARAIQSSSMVPQYSANAKSTMESPYRQEDEESWTSVTDWRNEVSEDLASSLPPEDEFWGAARASTGQHDSASIKRPSSREWLHRTSSKRQRVEESDVATVLAVQAPQFSQTREGSSPDVEEEISANESSVAQCISDDTTLETPASSEIQASVQVIYDVEPQSNQDFLMDQSFQYYSRRNSSPSKAELGKLKLAQSAPRKAEDDINTPENDQVAQTLGVLGERMASDGDETAIAKTFYPSSSPKSPFRSVSNSHNSKKYESKLQYITDLLGHDWAPERYKPNDTSGVGRPAQKVVSGLYRIFTEYSDWALQQNRARVDGGCWVSVEEFVAVCWRDEAEAGEQALPECLFPRAIRSCGAPRLNTESIQVALRWWTAALEGWRANLAHPECREDQDVVGERSERGRGGDIVNGENIYDATPASSPSTRAEPYRNEGQPIVPSLDESQIGPAPSGKDQNLTDLPSNCSAVDKLVALGWFRSPIGLEQHLPHLEPEPTAKAAKAQTPVDPISKELSEVSYRQTDTNIPPAAIGMPDTVSDLERGGQRDIQKEHIQLQAQSPWTKEVIDIPRIDRRNGQQNPHQQNHESVPIPSSQASESGGIQDEAGGKVLGSPIASLRRSKRLLSPSDTDDLPQPCDAVRFGPALGGSRDSLATDSQVQPPSTPETKQSSLPTPDFTLPMKSFKDFMTPSPVRTRRSIRLLLGNGKLPSTPILVNAAHRNPWISAKKTARRVSFAPLPGEDQSSSGQGNVDEVEEARTQTRAHSPPLQMSASELPSPKARFGKHFARAARKGPQVRRELHRSSMRSLLPTASQQVCASPAVDAMAEAFIEADNEAGTRTSDRIEVAEEAQDEAEHVRTQEEQETADKPDAVDDVSAVLLNLEDFIDIFNVDSELDKAKRVDKPREITQTLGMSPGKNMASILGVGVWS